METNLIAGEVKTALDVVTTPEDKAIVEILNIYNDIQTDIPTVACNEGLTHKTTIRTGLPRVYWTQINQGVPPSKSTTATVSDACGQLEARSVIDERLVQLAGAYKDGDEREKAMALYRINESHPYFEAMAQEDCRVFWYGNASVDDRQYTGMAYRLSDPYAANAENIISGSVVASGNDATLTGNKFTSIWLLGLGLHTMHAIHPTGTHAMLQREDLGRGTVLDTSIPAAGQLGQPEFEAYRERYRLFKGLTLRNWQYAVRGCNIEVSKFGSRDASVYTDLVNMMVEMEEHLYTTEGVKACFYVNRTIRKYLRLIITNKISDQLTWETVGGKRVMMFGDIPVRLSDSLSNKEGPIADNKQTGESAKGNKVRRVSQISPVRWTKTLA